MQLLNMQLKGLFTHPNPLSEVPEGALARAKNVVNDKEGIVETRRGVAPYGSQLTLGTSEYINNFFNYDDTILVHYANKLAYDSDDNGTWINYSGTYSPPSGAIKIKTVEENKNLYFTTSEGIKKLDSITTSPISAGVSRGLDGVATVLSTGSGFLSNNNQVAYRIVWGYRDARNNLILGSPSQRIIAINTSGSSQDVSLTFSIPAGITTAYFYQVYRSVMSGGATIVPNDELGLVYEYNPTAGEIVAASVTFIDTVPENLRGATLYTSPSQQGIGQSNDQPPLSVDICSFKNNVIYANTISKQRLTLTLISIGGSYGLAVNDTISIGGIVYTGKGTETASAAEFKVFTAGTPSANIDATAQSLIRVINQYSGNTLYYAYYLSGYNDLPGIIQIEERSIGGSSYSVISSKGSAFNPTIPVSGDTLTTSNDVELNALYVSKNKQPEAVPIANKILVGSANKQTYRVLALRSSVFIFRADGLWRLTGTDITNFDISLFDSTIILSAPESAVTLNNQVFAYTTQGVVAISDSGSAIISRPIELDLLTISTYPNFRSLTFGIAYESDRKYFLFEQKDITDELPKIAQVFNYITNSWVQWEIECTCGFVNATDDKLYLGSTNGYVYRERKSFSISDYVDDDIPVTITSYNSTTVTLNSTVGILVDYYLTQSNLRSKITQVINSTDIEIEDEIMWQVDSAIVYNPIRVEIQTVPQTGGNPGLMKQFRDIVVFFLRAKFNDIDISVKSDISVGLSSINVEPITEGPWGEFAWGEVPWGGGDPDVQTIRTYIPREKQMCHWLYLNITHDTILDYFALAGLTLFYENISERTR